MTDSGVVDDSTDSVNTVSSEPRRDNNILCGMVSSNTAKPRRQEQLPPAVRS